MAAFEDARRRYLDKRPNKAEGLKHPQAQR